MAETDNIDIRFGGRTLNKSRGLTLDRVLDHFRDNSALKPLFSNTTTFAVLTQMERDQLQEEEPKETAWLTRASNNYLPQALP